MPSTFEEELDRVAEEVLDFCSELGVEGEVGVVVEDPFGGPACVEDDVLVSSSDAGAHVQMMCAAGDTTLLLTRHVREPSCETFSSATKAKAPMSTGPHPLR